MDDAELSQLANRLVEDILADQAKPRLLNRADAAAYLGKSLPEFMRMVKTGKIPVTRIDTKIQFDRTILRSIKLSVDPVLPSDCPLGAAISAIQRRPATESLVYFVASGDNAVKVGVTEGLASRMRDLQAMNPVTLRLLLAIPGDRQTELALHAAFREQRISGEWYRPEGTLLAFLRSEVVREMKQARRIKELKERRQKENGNRAVHHNPNAGRASDVQPGENAAAGNE